jgi:hypothetical protein
VGKERPRTPFFAQSSAPKIMNENWQVYELRS